MALADYKITESDIAAHGVQSQPDKLTGTAAENKSVFDRLISEIIRVKLNGLVEELAQELAAKMDRPGAAGVMGQYLKMGSTGVEWDVPGGSGDMIRAIYDGDGDGVVNAAETAGAAVTAQRLAAPVGITLQDADGGNSAEAVSFDGSGGIILKLPAAIRAALTGNVLGNVNGNAATASQLATARKIGNADFDGSAGVTLAEIGAFPAAGGTVTGKIFLSADAYGETLPTDDYTAGRIFFKKV